MLLCSLDEGGGVCSPCQVICDLLPRNLVLLSDSMVVYKWSVCHVVPFEVSSDLFCVVDIQRRVVVLTPDDHLVHFLILGTTAVDHQSEHQKAQNTALRNPSVHGDGFRDVSANK